MNTPFTPAVPLWLVAAVLYRDENGQLVYAIDWTPVLALSTSDWRTSALIAHPEYPSPIWIAPSTQEWGRLNKLIDETSDFDEAIFISRVVVDCPDDTPDALDDLRLFNGLLLYCDDRLDGFVRVDELADQKLCWAALADPLTLTPCLAPPQ